MRSLLFAGFFGLLCLSPDRLQAEDREVKIPEGAKFLLHVDVTAFRQTTLGGHLFEMARKEAMREITRKGKDGDFEKVKEAIGFDPFSELQAVTIVGSSFRDPGESLQLILTLRQTTGNLEGLALTLPNHESTEYKKHEIHSAAEDGDERMHAAIHTDPSGQKRIVAARRIGDVKNMLDTLDGRRRGSSKAVKLATRQKNFVNIELLEIPTDQLERGPQVKAARMLQGISLKVGEKDESIAITATLRTREEKKAEQIQQLVQGLVAMLHLANDENEEVQRAREFLDSLKVTRDGTEVQLKLAIPEADLIDLIEEEMDSIGFDI